MEEIKIIEKPDWVSWDDIHELLLQAHNINKKKGIVTNYSLLPGEKIKEIVGVDGKCWIAMDGNKLVGTTSVGFFIGRDWWNKGEKVAHSCFTGIRRQYQGIGLNDQLGAKMAEYVRSVGVNMIQGDTAENNHTMRKIIELKGYKTVDLYASSSPHYAVRFVKWYCECPFSDQYINRRYKISEKLTKWRYKPGRIERSVFRTFFCRAASVLIRWFM